MSRPDLSVILGFEAYLKAANADPPWRQSETQPGLVLDALGREVLTVDTLRLRPDIEAAEIAELVLTAVNNLAGYRTGQAPQLELCGGAVGGQ